MAQGGRRPARRAARWGSSLPITQPTPLERRRLRILSALYKALESRGVTVHCARGGRIVEFRHQRDTASFELWEYVQHKRRPLTDAERADHWNADAKYRVEQIATKILRGKVPAYLPARVPTTWTETADTPFEGMLGEVAATVFTALAHAKAQREEREEAERRRWEAQQAAQQREEAAKREAARRQRLRDRAQHWREAEDLRAYVAAVEAAAARGQVAIAPADLAAWRAWALGCARDLDPLASGAAAELETAGEQG